MVNAIAEHCGEIVTQEKGEKKEKSSAETFIQISLYRSDEARSLFF